MTGDTNIHKDQKTQTEAKAKADSVKRWLITEYGREENEYLRQFVVELPDGCDPESLEGESISEVLGEDRWEMEDASGIYHDHFDVEGSADDIDYEGIPVIRLEQRSS